MKPACQISQAPLVVISRPNVGIFCLLPLVLLACSDDDESSFGRTDIAGTDAWSTAHVYRVNQHRQAHGVILLRWNELLATAALAHADDMAERNFFDHDNPEGENVVVRVTRTGYPIGAVGENLARGAASNNEVIDAWMRSPGHRDNIIFPEYTEIGAARVGEYWVQVFGTPASERDQASSDPARHGRLPQADG